MSRGNQREQDRKRAAARQGKEKKDDGLTPAQRNERYARAPPAFLLPTISAISKFRRFFLHVWGLPQLAPLPHVVTMKCTAGTAGASRKLRW